MEGVGRSKLSKFDLNCALSEDDAIALMNGVSQCQSLRRLKVSLGQIERAGSRVLLEHISTDEKLVELNMAVNEIGGEDSTASLQAMLEQNHHLQLLDLNAILISREVLDGIARGLRSIDSLRKLVLSDMSCVRFLCLGRSLQVNTSLEVLHLVESRTQPSYDEDALSECFGMVEGMQGLKEVTLDGVQLTEPAALALTKSLQKNVILQKFKMDYALISSDTMIQIYFYLSLNRFGQRLIRSDVSIPLGLWANVLAKMMAPKDLSCVFYFLKHKTDLVQMPMSGKRKAKTT